MKKIDRRDFFSSAMAALALPVAVSAVPPDTIGGYYLSDAYQWHCGAGFGGRCLSPDRCCGYHGTTTNTTTPPPICDKCNHSWCRGECEAKSYMEGSSTTSAPFFQHWDQKSLHVHDGEVWGWITDQIGWVRLSRNGILNARFVLNYKHETGLMLS